MSTDPEPGRPLSGLRVVELGEYVATPLATMMLADLGADVVKIERTPNGDPSRRFGHGHGGVSVQYVNCNRNKRSVSVDLKDDAGRAAVLELLAGADIAAFGLRSAALQRLGLDDEELAGANPRLIRAYITGYGDRGPLAAAPAFDSLLQAISGLTHVQGNGENPTLVRTFIADKVVATMCVQAVLAAVVKRSTTGSGSRLSISMLDAMAYFDFPDMMVRRTRLDDAEPGADIDAVGQAMRPIRASDGWLMITPVSGVQIARAFEAVGRPESQQLLRSVTDRAQLATRLVELLEDATVHGPVAHWLERLAAFDVPAAPVHSVDSHLSDPQVLANEIYGEHVNADLGRVRDVRYPAIFDSGAAYSTYRPAPRLGEHTEEILGVHGPSDVLT
jgi:crotonobetainyl-CoA:carnitine CoA-transferase CaiB-like acyl-CoA transferase